MKEIIVVQVGQCGNQIGRAFWKHALLEHFPHFSSTSSCLSIPTNKNSIDFHGNISSQSSLFYEEPHYDTSRPSPDIRARGLLIDMEPGVINETLQCSVIRNLFHPQSQTLTDGSGSGNNWAHGFYKYGSKHKDTMEDMMRQQSELCDQLDSVLVLHSLLRHK